MTELIPVDEHLAAHAQVAEEGQEVNPTSLPATLAETRRRIRALYRTPRP